MQIFLSSIIVLTIYSWISFFIDYHITMPYKDSALVEYFLTQYDSKLRVKMPELVTQNEQMSSASKLLALKEQLGQLEDALQMKKEVCLH